MKLQTTILIIAIVCGALSYLSADALWYAECSECIYGFLFFGAMSVGLLLFALAESYEQRQKL